jgi:two-component system sensor histidine kinase BaeS
MTPRPRATVQQRLVVTTIAISVGAVLLTGLLTAFAARRAARDAVADEMRREVSAFAQLANNASQRCVRPAQLVRFAQKDQVGFAFVRNGTVVRSAGDVRVGVLDPATLAAGNVETVIRPRFIVVGQPLASCPAGTPVFVLERTVGVGVGPIGRGLLVAALVSAVVAAGAAYALSRRIGQPLASMQRAARTIAGGDLTARVAITNDTPDELATLATALNEMAGRLEDARGLERSFLMSISHDLRTPLTSIRGYAEAIAEGAIDTDEARQRAVAVISQEGRRLERLVADLLDLARLDAHEFSLQLQAADIVPVVRNAAEAFAPAAEEAGVALQFNLAPSARAVVDPDRLGQVVGNLVENALKYATARMVVEVQGRGSSVELSVADDGPGIAPDDLAHVFDRLYTSRRGAARAVGTGLGLAIVRELTAAMGGEVRAETAPGGGSRMVLRLRAG